MKPVSKARQKRAQEYLQFFSVRANDLVRQAARDGVVLTIDRVPDPKINGKHKSVTHARLARGYY